MARPFTTDLDPATRAGVNTHRETERAEALSDAVARDEDIARRERGLPPRRRDTEQ